MLTANPAYRYQVGGSLSLESASYVTRQADEDLYQALKRSEFCYVLSARQMGKSSLRLRIMHRLQQVGVRSGVIDMTLIGNRQITLEQWYASILQGLVSSFKLPVSLAAWWRERTHLSAVKRFSEFLETVLLAEIEQPIVIFIDEVDSVLGLDFSTDDFFALIRACYNLRIEQPAYRRLTFALLGVATPSDLIADKSRTPFNIGQSIELKGFQLHESRPLLPGLQSVVPQPELLLQAILDWTGGQPFLTQKLCQLVLEAYQTSSYPANSQPANSQPMTAPHTAPYAVWLEMLVRSKVIDYWELRDDPEHLRTIAHRLLHDEQQAGRLLGLYQTLLTGATVPANDSREQIELLLSGLVVKEQGRLQVRNRIYQAVFNSNWVEQQLAQLRPYAAALTAWRQSDCRDQSRLLKGQALADAQTWAEGKSLSDLDYRFLAASQTLVQQERQLVLEAERAQELQARLKQEQKTASLQRKLLVAVGVALLITTGLGLLAFGEYRKAQISEVQAITKASETLFTSGRRLEALVEAIRAHQRLRSWQRLSLGGSNPQTAQVEAVLRQAAYGVVEYNQLAGHQDSIYRVAISPDGQMLASASRDGTAKLWSADGRLLHTLRGHPDWVTHVAFSGDGQTVISASKDKTVKLWRRDGTLMRTLIGQGDATLAGHGDIVFKIALSPDGQFIASASMDGTVKLWTTSTGRLVRTFGQHQGRHQGQVWSVAFSPDGQQIVSGGEDRTIKIWTLEGKLVRSWTGHRNVVQSLAFSPDGRMLASGSKDMSVKLWTVQGQLLQTYEGHQGEVLNVAFSRDGTVASSSSDGTAQLWQPDGTLLLKLEHGGRIPRGIAFSPDGKWFASGGADNTIKLWRLRDRFLTQLTGHQDLVARVAFSPDGNLLASASADKTVKLWTRQGQLFRTLRHQDGVFSVAFSPNGNLLAAGSEADGTIKLWTLEGELLTTLRGHQAGVYGLAFSPDGKTLASGSLDKTIRLWRIADKISPGGAIQPQDVTWIKTLKGHQQNVIAVRFSPDGQYLASAGWNGEILLWQPDGRLIRSIANVAGGVNDLTFSPDGQMLASANGDHTIKFWSLAGRLLQTFTGHQAHVIAVAFSPDGQRLVSVSQDRSVKLWQTDGTLLATLDAHSNTIPGVAFSPNGRLVASASWDRTVILWDLNRVVDLNQVLEFSCEWIKDYLTTHPQPEEQLCKDLD
nr:MAG: hypothetical protein EDM05_22080 [Leptolyngbya sp. IPPAS B-1204]